MYLIIGEAQHTDTQSKQALIAFLIIRGTCWIPMNCSIQLHGEPLGRTIEVEHISINTVLPAELPTSELSTLQC